MYFIIIIFLFIRSLNFQGNTQPELQNWLGKVAFTVASLHQLTASLIIMGYFICLWNHPNMLSYRPVGGAYFALVGKLHRSCPAPNKCVWPIITICAGEQPFQYFNKVWIVLFTYSDYFYYSEETKAFISAFSSLLVRSINEHMLDLSQYGRFREGKETRCGVDALLCCF